MKLDTGMTGKNIKNFGEEAQTETQRDVFREFFFFSDWSPFCAAEQNDFSYFDS